MSKKYSRYSQYSIHYNRTGRGHDRMTKGRIAAKDPVDAFRFAVEMMERLLPKEDISKWDTFFVVRMSRDDKFVGFGRGNAHGWKHGKDYPKLCILEVA